MLRPALFSIEVVYTKLIYQKYDWQVKTQNILKVVVLYITNLQN